MNWTKGSKPSHFFPVKIPTPYENLLSVVEGGKGVPYGGGPRSEGTTNHGFRPLKGKLEEILFVPEAKEDEALAGILTKINGRDTGLFSIGCVSGEVDEPDGRRVSGYVEFALNDKRLVADAINYFQIFFFFSQRLAEQRFADRVRFNWDLEGASFHEVSCHGLTCSVGVNTFFYPTKEGARTCWQNSLRILGDHLAQLKDVGFDGLY